MKNNLTKYVLAIVSLLAISACETDADTTAPIKDTAGMIINTSTNSRGALLGSPESGVDIKDAKVLISDAVLNLDVRLVSGSVSNGISKIEVFKSFNGGKGIKVAEADKLPLTLEYTSIDDFLQGTSVKSEDLRIGDTFTFKVGITKSNGEKYVYNKAMGEFSLILNCSYDLTGSYTMTNSVCNNPQTVQIFQKSDGSWYLSTADGGLLQFCTSNTTIQNDGSINVACEGIVSGVDGGPEYCTASDYGIGCIEKGSWDQEKGILTMEHSDAFFGVGSYTSTYTRN